jgi:hypothetical protein
MVSELEKAGKVYKIAADEMTGQVIQGLCRCGIQRYEYNESRKQLRFDVILFNDSREKISCEYILTACPSTGQIVMEYFFPYKGWKMLGHTLQWYIQKKNRQISARMGVNRGITVQYLQKKAKDGTCGIGISGRTCIRTEPERWVQRLLVRMNMQLQKDYEEITSLLQGVLPENIRGELIGEYKDYIDEWERI